MFDICIIDDELKAAEVVEALLMIYFKEEISSIQIFTNPIEASHQIIAINPDLIFLDIKMPGLNGFEFLEICTTQKLDVIFVTAYANFAIQALRKQAIDYLVKPIDEDDFIASFKRFKAHYSLKYDSQNTTTPLSIKGSRSKIALQKKNSAYFQKVDEVVRCEAKSNYTKFYFTDGSTLLSSKNLKQFEDLLKDNDFIRIHRSHLINLHHVSSLENGGFIKMTSGEVLPIAKRRRKSTHQIVRKMLNILSLH